MFLLLSPSSGMSPVGRCTLSGPQNAIIAVGGGFEKPAIFWLKTNKVAPKVAPKSRLALLLSKIFMSWAESWVLLREAKLPQVPMALHR